jgi:hypothetical protein
MVNCQGRKFQKGFPKGIVPESEHVWVTFDNKIHFPAVMDMSYQIDGNIFLNEVFEDLKLFCNLKKNNLKIQKIAKKMKLILGYYKVEFNPEKLGILSISQKRLNSLKEVVTTKEKFIFNCMGAFSGFIFPDKNLIPIKGSMLYFKNNKNIKDYYGIQSLNGEKFSILSTSEHIGIGVTKSTRPIDIAEDQIIMDDLYRKANSFFKPKL